MSPVAPVDQKTGRRDATRDDNSTYVAGSITIRPRDRKVSQRQPARAAHTTGDYEGGHRFCVPCEKDGCTCGSSSTNSVHAGEHAVAMCALPPLLTIGARDIRFCKPAMKS